ncbi:hypothetical protein OAJ56_00355 [Flavobacteriales bacterium]|nr:hypothetical protein [Flavobacteriales bacterium]
MKKISLLLCGILFITQQSFSQGEGAPFVTVFTNFNYDLSPAADIQDLIGTRDDFKAFEIKRAYLGYKYDFDDNLSAKVTFDIGSNSGGSDYTAYLKIASLNWKASENISLNMGMIGTKNFKFMEKSWGLRYIEKSAMDKYKWASSADAGISMDYKLMDGLSIDAQLINGEGYKNTQDDFGLLRYGVGLTYELGDLSFRVFRDNFGSETDIYQNITTAAASYSMGNLNIGGEKNIMTNASNIEDQSKDITSFYGSFKLNEKYSVFARMDNVSSEDDWNIDKDGTYAIGGIERKVTQGVKLAINIQSWKGLTNSGSDETLFMNLECKF